jgi:hypothetical protein
MKEEFYFINTEKLIVEFLLCNGMVQSSASDGLQQIE